MINLRSSESHFVAGAASAGAFPRPAAPEVVFAGRSNVGKSSVLNAVAGRRALARVGRSPGRTRQVNFFDLGGWCRLVDLPGYGWARASRQERQSWKPLVEGYFEERRPVALVLLLVDSRRGVGEGDAGLFAWLAGQGVPVRLLLTKADLVPAAELTRTVAQAVERLELPTAGARPLLVSARTGRGVPPLRALIRAAVQP